jgi:hypothetical protein
MFCTKCGKRRVGGERFCLACGSSMEFGIARAKIQNQSQFRGQRDLLFWGYLAGVAVHGLLTISSDTPWAIGLLSLAELAVFIVAFVRAKHNWLVIWAYLAGARALATLMWLAFWGAFGAPGIVILGSLLWFALVPVLLYWHNQIAVQQSLKSWIPTGSPSDW